MIVVVPTERHVERALRARERAETRASLLRRLLDALAPDVVLASDEEVRLALAVSSKETLGDVTSLRTLDAIFAALEVLRASLVDADALDAAARGAPEAVKRRARLLADAMRGVDDALARAGLVDGRRAGELLARAIARTDPERVRAVLGGDRVTARWIVTWEPSDVAWWRALDASLSRTRGAATIELPAIEARLDAARAAAPLEIVLDDLARALDEAPHTIAIDSPLGDLSLQGKLRDEARVEIREATDAAAQGAAIVDAVRAALAEPVTERAPAQLSLFDASRAKTTVSPAAPLDGIAVALPTIDDETFGAIRDALDAARIPAHTPQKDDPMRCGSVAVAMDALAIAERGLPRRGVATLLRSAYVDMKAAMEIDTRAAHELARALDETPSRRGDDAIAALEATARAWPRIRDRAESRIGRDARAIGEELAAVARASTRREHIAAALRVWTTLGIAERARAAPQAIFATDDAPRGLARAELLAVAREARGWQLLADALDTYEASAARIGALDAAASGAVFRHELTCALQARTAPAAASRAGALRVARLSELAGEPLDLLIVADANDGVVPSRPSGDAILSEALAARLRARAPDFAPPSPHVRAARELAMLAAAAANARRVIVCARSRDEAGADLAPAPLVSWLEHAGAPTLRVTNAYVHAARPSRESARRAAIERARESFFEADRADAGELVGRLAPHEALARVLADETGGGARPLAVTGLEKLATCAFQGFASVVLRADERRAVADAVDARESGTLLHDALAAAFRAAASQWSARPRDQDAIHRAALAASDAVLAREAAASGIRKVAIDRIREGVTAVVAWSANDDEWDFALAEQAFGDAADSSWPALVLNDDDGARLAIRGSIDRVDVAHAREAVRVIDYKSSDRAAQRATKGLGETTFQIALYASVAARARGAREGSGLYVPAVAASLPMKRRRAVASAKAWASAHEPIEGRPTFEARALEAVSAVRSGALVPDPIEKSACERCAFDGGCRKPRFVIRGTAPDEGH
jgi:hypothetical protein